MVLLFEWIEQLDEFETLAHSLDKVLWFNSTGLWEGEIDSRVGFWRIFKYP